LAKYILRKLSSVACLGAFVITEVTVFAFSNELRFAASEIQSIKLA